MSETVLIEARLVGNKSGKVYAQNQMSAETIFKEPEVYVGDCLLSIPMGPVEGEPFPEALDPADTKILLQFRTNSASTRFGRDPEAPFGELGHWRAFIDVRPQATVKIPSGGAV